MYRSALLHCLWSLALTLCGGAVLHAQESPYGSSAGVVVEQVGEGSAKAAGILPGDLLLTWERLPNPPANPDRRQGDIASIFDWLWLEIEQAPRGTVRLTGRRGGTTKTFTLAPGLWALDVNPPMPADLLEQGRERFAAGGPSRAVEFWADAAASVEDRRVRFWIFLLLGRTWTESGDWEKAHAAFRSALEETPEPLPRSVLWRAIGTARQMQNRPEPARQAYESARRIREAAWGDESLALAECLSDLAVMDWLRGEWQRASDLWARTLEIREKLAPDSLAAADSLDDVGVSLLERGYVEGAAVFLRRALEIRERLAPDSLAVAESLNNLGGVASQRGDLGEETELYRRSLEIQERLAPESLQVAQSLHNLGALALERGDLERAIDLELRSLEIRERLAPGSLDVATGLSILGSVAWRRGEAARAVDLVERALAIREELAPHSLGVGESLNNLGVLALERGDLEQATSYLRRAFAIRQDLAPDGPEVAQTLNNLAMAAFRAGDPGWEEDSRRALAIRERLAPDSLDVAESLNNHGAMKALRGDMEGAAEPLTRALEIRERLSPGSALTAGTLHSLGSVYLESSPPRPLIAYGFFSRALDVLERQFTRLGGAHEVRAGFLAQYHDLYRDTLELQLALGEPDAAFHTLERSRARSFLEQLAERETVATADVPEDLDRERRRLGVLYDRAQQQLSELNSRDHAEQIEALLDRLRRLRDEAKDVEEKIRRASPRLAALQYPRPLDLAAARSALDPGTLMLSYSVGKDESVLFVVSGGRPLEVHRLPIGEELLREQVSLFRRQIHGQGWTGRTASRYELGKWLYERLIEPAADAMRQAARILIVPDGPLHVLPFAALVRETGAGAGRTWQYLVEWKPLHSVVSATVYQELTSYRDRGDDRRPGAPALLVAFGDPRYPGGAPSAARASDVYVRAAVERGFDFSPLPYTRLEVESITRLFPRSESYLGAEALEERAKTLADDVRILHFATHGTLDHRDPFNSAVALTLPEELSEERENGLLQVWEIFESVRLDADLVVLSACESGLGLELSGEGLIGLTRAFQYAGARTVAATLWNVADQTTAVLMERFYRHLRAGRPKDEALRAAQLELIRAPVEVPDLDGRIEVRDASAPFYWAGFQLYGDWR